MGYAARSNVIYESSLAQNAAARAAGKPRPRHTYTTSGPVSRPLRLTDADGREIYRELPWGQVVRVTPKAS